MSIIASFLKFAKNCPLFELTNVCQFAKKLQNSNETKLVALKVELSSQWHLEFLCKKSQSQMESFFFQITFVDTICIHFEMYPMYSRL